MPPTAGGVLAACLVPQLYKLWATQSARDLSYLFLTLYNLGLTLTFVYLYFEDALVAWICVLIELGGWVGGGGGVDNTRPPACPPACLSACPCHALRAAGISAGSAGHCPGAGLGCAPLHMPPLSAARQTACNPHCVAATATACLPACLPAAHGA